MQPQTQIGIQQQTVTSAVAQASAVSSFPTKSRKKPRYEVRPYGAKFVPYDTWVCAVPLAYVGGVESLAACEAIVQKLSEF